MCVAIDSDGLRFDVVDTLALSQASWFGGVATGFRCDFVRRCVVSCTPGTAKGKSGGVEGVSIVCTGEYNMEQGVP